MGDILKQDIPIDRNGAVVADTSSISRVFESQVFTMAKRFTIAGSATLYVGFDPALFLKGSLIALPLGINGLGSAVDIDVCYGADFDADGTLLSVVNRDLSSDIVPKSVLRKDPTINSEGVCNLELLLPADGVAAVALANGTAEQSLPVKLRLDTKMLLKLVNTTADAAKISINFSWIEIPPNE